MEAQARNINGTPVLQKQQKCASARERGQQAGACRSAVCKACRVVSLFSR